MNDVQPLSIRACLEHITDLVDRQEAEITMLQETVTQLRDELALARKTYPGHVVVTRRADSDDVILVSRQDDDGRILSIIWEKGDGVKYRTETPTEMMDDTADFATRHQPLD